MNEIPPADAPPIAARETDPGPPHEPSKPFTGLPAGKDDYTDGRAPWDWKSKYSDEARRGINFENRILFTYLAAFLALSGFGLSFAGGTLQVVLNALAGVQDAPGAVNADCRLLALFFVGCLGGTTFSMKWLIHAVAKGRWHLDRRYWRLIVPLLGGVYACVVLTLLDAGFLGGTVTDKPRPLAVAAALAFLIGYFSDGVSGLLSNIAGAVFGTLDKK